MIGHGRPTPWRGPLVQATLLAFVRAVRADDALRALGWALASALVLWTAAAAAAVPAAETNLRLRIAWGGGAERQWQGTIELERGTLSEAAPLGIEADEPGSIWLEDRRVMVRQRSLRLRRRRCAGHGRPGR